MIRVVLVDDHVLVRVGFRMLLGTVPGFEVVGEADDGEQACRLQTELSPDVLVLDLSMPGGSGLEALRRILARDPRARVLVLSAHEDTAHPRRVLKAGALGYLSKRGAPDALAQAVRAVAAGQRWLDPLIAQKLALDQIEGGGNPVDALSEREFAVFLALARGQSVAEIALEMKVSSSTVGTHLYNVKQKLDAANQAELTLIALRWGLIQP